MKRNAPSEPDIHPIRRFQNRGLVYRAAEDRQSGEVVVTLEYCGKDRWALVAAAAFLLTLADRVKPLAAG